MISSGERWAIMHELSGPEPSLAALIGRLAPVDLVLVEGFKANPHPKIEVFRPALDRDPVWPGRPDIVAVASDAAVETGHAALLPLNEPDTIVDWAMTYLRSHAALHITP
jgi:molybdopterin-guanine dinucleotide biosynthesis protein B